MPARRHQATMLAGNRLHLNEGPIDLVIWADGAPEAVTAAYRAAERRFDGLLAELVAELALLRRPLGDDAEAHIVPGVSPTHAAGALLSSRNCAKRNIRDPGPRAHSRPLGPGSPLRSGRDDKQGGQLELKGPIARRMAQACWPYRAQFITPMAAVAGAVAEAVLGSMMAATTPTAPLKRAYVNDGGDIALHLAPGASLAIGVVRSLEKAVPEGEVRIDWNSPVRGIATSGWRGRSFSLGIADAVTVLARDAPSADAAATIIANAVNIDDPAVVRRPARALDPDSDLGDRPVTVEVGVLGGAQIEAALTAGVAMAEHLRSAGLIEGALLALAGEWRSVGAPVVARVADSSRV
jgi:ApbE superfamily uncharacterized protein (UPF0280 family)